MKVLKYDPQAQKMEMFDAMEAGFVTVRIVAHNAQGGNMYFENTSGKRLTIQLPKALATVHVLKQFGGGFGAVGAFGGFGNSGISGGGVSGGQVGNLGGSAGGGQSGGAGFGGQGGLSQGGGSGLFSIPPDRVAEVPFQSVCLNYNKPDPSPRMTYVPVRLEHYTDDKVLQETLRMFGTGQLDHRAAQAAAWHLTDHLTWEQLASLREYTLPGVYTSQVPTFSTVQLETAQNIVKIATRSAEERMQTERKPTPPRSNSGRFRAI